MEIPPVIYTSDKAMIVRHCMEILQKQCRYFHRYSWVEQANKIYGRIWAVALGSVLLWGKPFCQHPGDTVTFQHHSEVCDSALPQWPWWPWRKFFVCLDGGKASSSIKWHSTSRRLNPITQFLTSGNLFWDFFLPESQSKTLHDCMFSSSWFSLYLENTVTKC